MANLITAPIVAGIQSNAALTAASEQQQEANNALDFQKQVFGQEQQNISPFLSAGQTSIGQLLQDLNSGKFGPGSLPPVPTAPAFNLPAFQAPTLEQAEQTPGYQFTAQQGTKGILEAAAAAGGAITGGTLKAADAYNTGLANTTYNDVFSRALSSYNTGLQSYASQLAGYGSQLAGYQTAEGAQQQGFQQLFAPIALGENAASSLNASSQNAATSVAQLLAALGNSQAAGTIGSANAISSGITNVGNSANQGALLSYLLSSGGGGAGALDYQASLPTFNRGSLTPGAGFGGGGGDISGIPMPTIPYNPVLQSPPIGFGVGPG